MRIEIIPTKNGNVFLDIGFIQQEPKVNPKEWNDSIDWVISFLESHKLDTNNQYKKALDKKE